MPVDSVGLRLHLQASVRFQKHPCRLIGARLDAGHADGQLAAGHCGGAGRAAARLGGRRGPPGGRRAAGDHTAMRTPPHGGHQSCRGWGQAADRSRHESPRRLMRGRRSATALMTCPQCQVQTRPGRWSVLRHPNLWLCSLDGATKYCFAATGSCGERHTSRADGRDSRRGAAGANGARSRPA